MKGGFEDKDSKYTVQTLAVMKQEVCSVFGDYVARIELDAWTLIEMLDERPSIVRKLMSKRSPTLSTMAILEHLDTLRTHLTQQ